MSPDPSSREGKFEGTKHRSLEEADTVRLGRLEV